MESYYKNLLCNSPNDQVKHPLHDNIEKLDLHDNMQKKTDLQNSRCDENLLLF